MALPALDSLPDLIPRFAPPPAPSRDPLPADATTRQPGSLPPATDSRPPSSSPDSPNRIEADAEPLAPSTPPGARIRTSTGGDLREPKRPATDAKVFAEVLAGFLGVLATAAGFLVRRRGRVLREPTDAELDAIAQPLGRIANRHLPDAVVPADALDLIAASGQTRRYLRNGPLLTYPAAEPLPNTEENYR